MSQVSAYNRMSGRSKEEDLTPEEESAKIELKNLELEELKRWIQLPKTKDLLVFLGKRELELLNNARNCSKMKLGNENTDKNLQKSIAYREIIDYLTQNKQPTEE